MTSYLESLRDAPTPLAVTSRSRLIEVVKEAHLEVLKLALRWKESPTTLQSIPALRRYALWLEDVALAEDAGDGQFASDGSDREQLCNLAATLYEFVGTLTSDQGSLSIFHPPLNDLLRSAILSSFTPYQAHASLVSRRVRQRIREYRSESPTETCHKLAAVIISNLLARDFHAAFLQSNRLNAIKADAIDELKRVDAPNAVYLQLDRALALGRVCGNIGLGMLVGIPKLITDSLERLEVIKARAFHAQDAQHHWIADRLHRIGEQMLDSSMHRILGLADLPETYRHLLARDHYLELWEPQRRAITHGLLDDVSKHCIVSIPTGSGKTLFAEMSILAALRGDGERWAIYVAPSRALVNQVSSELRHRLERCNITVRTVIAGAEQSFVLSDELELIRMNRTVTVTTPEKLDAYYRNAKEVFDSCRLIIFDEAHKISETERGPLVESLITRFLSLQSQTRIMLLSGMMSNVDELRTWLGENETIAISETRRPTRQIFGVAVRHEPLVPEPEKRRKNGDIIRRVAFAGGFIVVHEKDDLTGHVTVNLPDVFQGYYTEKLSRRTRLSESWREDRTLPHSSTNDHAIATAQKLVRAPGTILVFVQRVAEAERCCRDFVIPDNVNASENTRRLANFLRAELGRDHPLANYCLRGYAYHHGRLPNIVQRAIELALEQGWLRIVFATSTLREGINSSATTVILSGNAAYDEIKQQRIPISEVDFFNLAGRAGRPRVDTEGRVFLIPDSLVPASAVQQGKTYILAGESALRVRSQLKELATAINQMQTNSLLSLSATHQSFLLALEAASIANEDGIAGFLQRTLWSFQEDDNDLVTTTFQRAARVMKDTREAVGEDNLRIASRLGLSLTSAEKIRLFLASHIDAFDSSGLKETDPQEQRLLLLQIALQLDEIKRGYFKSRSEPEMHLEPIESWINGRSYPELLEIARRTGVVSERDDISDIVRYAADISTWLSWAFGASHSVLTQLLDEPDDYVGILPLLVRYGVPTAAAAYVSLLGITDRIAAQRLGRAFEATGRSVTLSEISDWLRSIEPQLGAILAEDDHGLRTELIKRQILRERTGSRSPYRVSQFRATADIEEGRILICRDIDERVLLIDQGNSVGEILEPGGLLTLIRRDREEFLGVSLMPLPSGSVGRVALINLTILSH